MKITLNLEADHCSVGPLTIVAMILGGEGADIDAADMAKALHYIIDLSELRNPEVVEKLLHAVGECSTYRLFKAIESDI